MLAIGLRDRKSRRVSRHHADMLAANGDQATAFIILGSIIVPLVLLAMVCWFFWTHRHDD
jgi:hypothetical protein